MRKNWLAVSVLVMALFLIGCGAKEEEKDAPPPNAPINNNAPEAKNAPAAPVSAGVPRPGGPKNRLP